MLDILEKLNAVYSDCLEKKNDLASGLAGVEKKASDLSAKEAELKEREKNVIPIENLNAKEAELKSLSESLSQKLSEFEKRESGFMAWAEEQRQSITVKLAEISNSKKSIEEENQSLKKSWNDYNTAKENMRVDVQKEILAGLGRS